MYVSTVTASRNTILHRNSHRIRTERLFAATNAKLYTRDSIVNKDDASQIEHYDTSIQYYDGWFVQSLANGLLQILLAWVLTPLWSFAPLILVSLHLMFLRWTSLSFPSLILHLILCWILRFLGPCSSWILAPWSSSPRSGHDVYLSGPSD